MISLSTSWLLSSWLLGPEVNAQDTDPYDLLLQAHVHGSSVDYQGIRSQRAVLDGYLDSLARADLSALDRSGTMAFWINTYNALTLDLVADAYPLGSIMELDDGKVWDTRTFRVAGQSVTLNAIEHTILRPMGDPRIHAAISCASRGCPPLSDRAFSAEQLDRQLDAACLQWAGTNAMVIDRQAGTIGLSSIFDWFGDDFTSAHGQTFFDIPEVTGKPEAALNFLSGHLDPDTAAWIRSGGHTTSFLPYDWKLND
ncbi:MAG: DUF547 domain-containing protein [Myxococcota bacterium]|jgi:hypothetical protein|nr:DUF547 domain-containing protein [Myxococcota bacterium]